MNDVFPRRNLPDDAEPWGREHDNRVYALESSVSSLQASLQGQNRNNASSIQTLGDQVSDLAGRESYSASAPALIFRLPNTLAATAWGPNVSFTLERPRIVSLEFVVGTFFQAGGTAALTYTRGALFINGASYNGASRTESGISGMSGLTPGGYGTLSCRAVLPLPAGTHTVSGGYVDTQVIGASSWMELRSPSVFADVLQPA
jgi:hypothetical protein